MIYSYTTKEEEKRVMIAVLIFSAGIRFAMLSGSMSAPLYMGCLLSNFSVAANYYTTNSMKFQILNLLMIFGLMIQSYAVNSSICLIIALFNFFGFVTVLLTKKQQNKNTRNLILVVLFILTIMLWILSGFNLNAFFNIVEEIMKLLPFRMVQFIFKFFDQSLLPEQKIAKFFLRETKNFLLG